MSSARAPADIEAILLDIEGTTTPISFVYEVLFPFVRRHLADHIEAHAHSLEYTRIFDALREERESDIEASAEAPPASITAYCEWLMDRDRKSTALKELQGKIWEEGYARGDLVGEVYPDVPPALVRWGTQGRSLAIFSSGSVLAQQLLFRHSSAGDLSGFLRWYFDTTIGAKGESDSYRRIAGSIGVETGRALFVSDVTRELDAARTAGMDTRLAIRPGNSPTTDNGHTVIRTFDDLG